MDVSLDAYLEPERFNSLAKTPYGPRASVLLKLFVCPQQQPLAEVAVEEISRWLPSFRRGDFSHLQALSALPRTVDLESSAGSVLLCYRDDDLLMHDYLALHNLELRAFELLFPAEPRIMPCPQLSLNGGEMRLFETETIPWLDFIRCLGQLNQTSAPGDCLRLLASGALSEEAWTLLLDAFGWQAQGPGLYCRR